MKQKRFLGLLPAFCLLTLPVTLMGQSRNELALSMGTNEFNAIAEVVLSISTTDEVQGFVAAFDWDAAGGTGLDLVPAAALVEADTVVTRIEPDFMVIGVVMDSDPMDNGGIAEIIGPGDNIDLATAQIQCAPQPAPEVEAVVTPVEFRDQMYSATDPGPVLDNVVVVGGLSIGFNEGLILTDGELRCTTAPDKLIIETGGNAEGALATADIKILMNNNAEVEGFVTSVCHDPAQLTLNGVSLGADSAQADFTAIEFKDDGGGAAFGVVIDLVDPMASPPNIPAAQGNHIASYNYTCADDIVASLGPGQEFPVNLEFCDNVIGQPLKENLIVVGGLSVTNQDGLVLENGQFICRPAIEPPSRETACGLGADVCCSNGIDDDRDGLTDLDDPDCQQFDFEVVDPETLLPAPIIGTNGDVAFGLLAYNAPTEADLGIDAPGSGDLGGGSPVVATQGFSLGFSYDCDLVNTVPVFDISGTILDAVGAEFVGVQSDNDPVDDDGDGCSLVLGVLVDALPPFDGATIPALSRTQPLGRLGVLIPQDAPCGTPTTIVADDGVNGTGTVPVRNVISVNNQAFRTTVRTIEVIANKQERFFRGDCNFSLRSDMLDPVNIADAASVVSFLFQRSSLRFTPPCEKACDANDDGRIDLADAIGILNYLFVPGSAFPPNPGPGLDPATLGQTPPGPDPTEDPLTCVEGSNCDVNAL